MTRSVWLGVLGGLVGAVLMSMVEMVNELVAGHSFFLPPHMIAAPFTGASPMQHAMTGGPFYLEGGPFVLGLALHMMWTAAWGAAFGLLAGVLRIAAQNAIPFGAVYGLVVGFVMSYIVLPAVRLDPIPQTSGWLAFVLMHVAFGLGPGVMLWYGSRTERGMSFTERTAA